MGSMGFSIDLIFVPALWSWGRLTASSRNEYQGNLLRGKGGRCLELTLAPSRADCPETLEASTSRSPQDLFCVVTTDIMCNKISDILSETNCILVNIFNPENATTNKVAVTENKRGNTL